MWPARSACLSASAFPSADLLDKRIPRWIPLVAWILVLTAQTRLYLVELYPSQRTPGDAGGLATALRELTDLDESIIIAGADWSSIIPYYAERRALMIRSDLTHRPDYLEKAFANMQDAQVTALVLLGPERNNTELHQLAQASFDLDPRPVFTWHHGGQEATVYFSRQLRPTCTRADPPEILRSHLDPARAQRTQSLDRPALPLRSLLPQLQKLFRVMTPRPVRFLSTFGPELWNADTPGRERYARIPTRNSGSPCRPAFTGSRTDIEIEDSSWQNVPIPMPATASRSPPTPYSPTPARTPEQRYLYPASAPRTGAAADQLAFELPAGAELEFSVNPGPAHNGARDWVTLGYITIK